LSRPIAWITSQGPEGVVNLAPFSFLNAVGASPVYSVVSVGLNDAGELKDTACNIQTSGEFVVNMVTEDLFDAMNLSAADFPADMSELEIAGPHTTPSIHISVPRLAEALVSMECKLHQTQSLGGNTLIIGEVVMFHVADHLVGERFYIDGFAPIGRLGSPSVYCRTKDRFDIPRISYAQWLKTQKSGA
jgi:flavin reductase (DIM6/NTAB) family NADH-FMN oxidoreductase RutF